VLELKGSIRVLCRIRPFLEKEQANLEVDKRGNPIIPVQVCACLQPHHTHAGTGIGMVQQSLGAIPEPWCVCVWFKGALKFFLKGFMWVKQEL